jgi:hypothetical protein
MYVCMFMVRSDVENVEGKRQETKKQDVEGRNQDASASIAILNLSKENSAQHANRYDTAIARARFPISN